MEVSCIFFKVSMLTVLEILPNLPSHLSQSMFATPGKHDIALRFSSEPTDLVPDNLPQPRGIGMKVFNVVGKKMRPDGQDPQTQDLEFNSSPILELGSAEVCRDIIGLRLQYGACPADLTAALRKRDDFDVQDARNHGPNQHVFAQRQYSQSAFRYGEYIAKFALVPAPDSKNILCTDHLVKEADSPTTALRNGLTEYLEKNPADFLLQVQLCQDLQQQPVEDSRIDWNQEKFPFETVAKVHIPSQDPFLPKRVAFWRDEMRVDPWHGLESLKPLGSINRCVLSKKLVRADPPSNLAYAAQCTRHQLHSAARPMVASRR